MDMHHWTFAQMYEMDMDDVMTYITYYPKWREAMTGKSGASNTRQEVFADQVQF